MAVVKRKSPRIIRGDPMVHFGVVLSSVSKGLPLLEEK